MGDKKEDVKQWYDGFTFGGHRDIYNPWSITNYLKEKKFRPYWASTSSNGMVGKLIRKASVNLKEKMEDVDYRGITLEPWYKLNITNLETVSMFLNMFKGWFESSDANYNDFIKALLRGNLKEMNIYMNDVALATFSSFDTGRQPSHRSQPERFYHGFVLGLIVELSDRYEVKSKNNGFLFSSLCFILFLREVKTVIIFDIQQSGFLQRTDGYSSKCKSFNFLPSI